MRTLIFYIVTLTLLGLVILIPYGLVRLMRRNRIVAVSISLLLILAVGYNAYDNYRVLVRTETVYIDDLPPAFEGFTMLQMTDLHGKYFGAGHERLAALINSLQYDAIIVTGDMATTSKSFEPFTSLLDRIVNKDCVVYINGNKDLAFYSLSGQVTKSGQDLQEHGSILLTEPYGVTREGKTLWLINDLSRTYYDLDVYQDIPRREFRSESQYQAYREHIDYLNRINEQIKASDSVKIDVTHIPYTRSNIDDPASFAAELGIDLIIAGHYHGGQIRIPGYGALYVPVPGRMHYGFLPEQSWVNGLMESNGIQQYISRGLGASNLPLRLFDTPEINLITLRAK